MQNIRSYKELRIYQTAIDAAMQIFELTKHFPADERFSMVDQMRRASRSVCSNIGEAWRKASLPSPLRKQTFGFRGRGGGNSSLVGNWPSVAATFHRTKCNNSMESTMDFLLNLST